MRGFRNDSNIYMVSAVLCDLGIGLRVNQRDILVSFTVDQKLRNSQGKQFSRRRLGVSIRRTVRWTAKQQSDAFSAGVLLHLIVPPEVWDAGQTDGSR
jgi:hypothetical protein